MKWGIGAIVPPVVLALCGVSSSFAENIEAHDAAMLAAARTPAGVALTVAKISAGRLLIVGTTSRPGVEVGIDGTPLRAKSDAAGSFRFDVNYRTPDCNVTLATRTGRLPVLIGDCGPGVVPRGAWAGGRLYAANDLVLDGGATWRAVRPSKGKRPSINAADWQLFAARGATGAQGPVGRAGPKGDTGDAGPQGPAGETGLTGPQGEPGLDGAQGPAGPAGPKGDTGDAGPQGETGPQGPQGDPGLDGAQGPAGPAGPKGDTGAQGSSGPQGPQGEPGLDGAQGPAGLKGDTGDVGPQGPQGATGPQGPAGPAGPKGDAGNTGAQGPSGPQGVAGAPGESGPAGPPGAFGWEIARTESESNADSPKTLVVTCPEKKIVLSVGTLLSDFRQTAVSANFPESISSWIVTVEETVETKNEWSFTASAVCVAIP